MLIYTLNKSGISQQEISDAYFIISWELDFYYRYTGPGLFVGISSYFTLPFDRLF